MGLLDDLPKSVEDFKAQMAEATRIAEGYYAEHPGTPAEQAIRERMMAGETPAMILGLEKPHRDALLMQGLKYLQLKELDQAHDLLTFVLVLDPLEERATYGLGVIAQLRGDYKVAAKTFVQFLALDATNPEGYLRLGECFLANRELEAARDAFQTVVAMGKAGTAKASHVDHARRMLGLIAPDA